MKSQFKILNAKTIEVQFCDSLQTIHLNDCQLISDKDLAILLENSRNLLLQIEEKNLEIKMLNNKIEKMFVE